MRGRVQFLIVITLSNSRHFLAFLLNIQILTTILKYTLFNSNNDAKKRWHAAVWLCMLLYCHWLRAGRLFALHSCKLTGARNKMSTRALAIQGFTLLVA